MESDEGIRLRKQALKPIQTKIPKGISSEKYDEDDSDDGEERPLSPTSRLFQEPNLNLHIVSIIGCKSRLDPEIVKANLPHTLLKNYRFSSVLVADKDGVMKWVKTKVDLDKHIRVPEVDHLADSTPSSGDKVVEDYAHNLTKTFLNDDMSRPLWDLHILNVKTSEAEGTAIFRFHHSLGDGVSFMSILRSCTRQASNPKALATLHTNNSNIKNKDMEKMNGFGAKLLLFLFGIWWFLRLFLNTIIDFLVVSVSMFMYQDKGLPKIKGTPARTPRTIRRIVFKNVNLEDLKLVKNKLNTTINVVVVGATQAALSMYYNRRFGLLENRNEDEGPTEKEIKDNLPKKLIRLRSVVIVNVRQLIGFRVSNKIGNWIGYVHLPLHIKLKDDPLDYVREAKAKLDRKRHSLEAICTFGSIGLLYKIFGIKVASAIFRRSSGNSSIAFSNLVGPLEEVNFHGYSLSYFASSTYGQPVELMVTFQSYMDKMTIVLSGDEDFFPELHQLRDDIAESLKRITNSVKEKLEDDVAKEKESKNTNNNNNNNNNNIVVVVVVVVITVVFLQAFYMYFV